MRGVFSKWSILLSRSLVVLIGLISILLQFATPAYAQATDPPCIHGMRVVGEQTIYLSHMGLFSSNCHDYQGIFEVTFAGSRNPQSIYLDAQKQNLNQNEFTLEPTEKFVLPDLASGKVSSFKAKLHQGQYERIPKDSGLLDGNATVNVKRVLHFRQFNSGARIPSTSEYLLFGTDTEQLAAHLITAPPDFDQIVAVKTPLSLSNTELAKALRLVLPNRPTKNAEDNLSQVLKVGQKPAVRVNGREPNLAIEAGDEYFLETADYRE